MLRFWSGNHDPSLSPARIALVHIYLNQRISSNFYQMKVNVQDGQILEKRNLEGHHSHVDSEDLERCEAACLSSESVQAAIKKLNLPEKANVVVEPWTYATDGVYDMKDKVTMVRHHSEIFWTTADFRTVLLLHEALRSSRCKLLRLSVGFMRRAVGGFQDSPDLSPSPG